MAIGAATTLVLGHFGYKREHKKAIENNNKRCTIQDRYPYTRNRVGKKNFVHTVYPIKKFLK